MLICHPELVSGPYDLFVHFLSLAHTPQSKKENEPKERKFGSLVFGIFFLKQSILKMFTVEIPLKSFFA